MDEYSSVSAKFLPHFEKAFVDLPPELRPLVEKVFALISWDATPIRRRPERTAQWDFDHDPACDDAQERMFELQAKIDEEQDRLLTDVLPRWKLPADYFDKLGYQGLLAAMGTRAARESAVVRGLKSGTKRRRGAEEWRTPALELAKDVRSKDPGMSQVGLARAMMEQWPKAFPGKLLPVDIASLIKFIQAMEHKDLLPRRRTKRHP